MVEVRRIHFCGSKNSKIVCRYAFHYIVIRFSKRIIINDYEKICVRILPILGLFKSCLSTIIWGPSSFSYSNFWLNYRGVFLYTNFFYTNIFAFLHQNCFFFYTKFFSFLHQFFYTKFWNLEDFLEKNWCKKEKNLV